MHRTLPFLVSSLALTVGCGATPPPVPEGAPAAVASFATQVAQGQKLYGAHCASCHGAAGEGAGAPAVVGLAKGALPLKPASTAKHRTGEFKTVADVGGFVMKTMPPNAPGSLKPEEYLAILAFDLKANGIDLGAKTLDLPLAQTLVIPR